MPTDDERREVAARLRAHPTRSWHTVWEELCSIENACGCGVGQDLQDMDLKERLADLIEPEPERTCTLTDKISGDGTCLLGVECSECGERFARATGKHWRYCPSCGAEVES